MPELKGIEKAAILLISLGKESASEVLKNLPDSKIEKVAYEIANCRTVDGEKKKEILKDFYQVCLAQEYVSEGGIDYAKAVLKQALGSQKSMDLINKMSSILQEKPFNFMRDVDTNEIINFLNYESDQTAALVMSYLDSRQAAHILSALSNERQAEIIKRIALMDKISPNIIKEVEEVMRKKFANVVTQTLTETEGIDAVVEILSEVDRATEKIIFERLDSEDEELSDEVKKRMFVFEDIVNLDDASVQKFLTDVDNNDLAVALKSATNELKALIFKNMSKRASDVVKEEIEFMGPVRLSEVEKAQQKIVNSIRRLDEKGEIILRKSGGDEIIE